MKMKKKFITGRKEQWFSMAAILTELVPIDNNPVHDGLLDVIVSYLQKMHHVRKKYLRYHQYMLTGWLATNNVTDAYGNAPNVVGYADDAIKDKFAELCTIENIEKKLGHKTTIFQKECWVALRQIAVEVANSFQAK